MTKKDYDMIAATFWLTKPLLISYKTPEDWQVAFKQWRGHLSILGLTLSNADKKFKLATFNGIAHSGKDWNKCEIVIGGSVDGNHNYCKAHNFGTDSTTKCQAVQD